MALKYILCPVTGGAEDGPALAAALHLGQRFGAHVRALFVRSSVTAAIPYLGEGLTGSVIDNIVQAASKASDDSLTAANTHVAAALKSAGAAESAISIRVLEGVIEDEVAAASRLADIVVYARDPADSAFPDRSLAEHTLLGARRPILIAPPTPLTAIGERIVILWDGGTSAAAAFIAALPFIKRAGAVEVITMASDDETAPALLDDLNDALSIRGLTAAMRAVDHASSADGARLLAASTETGADLIVMGGYGHSRLRQLVFGGVTRHMLRHTSVPVLMAH